MIGAEVLTLVPLLFVACTSVESAPVDTSRAPDTSDSAIDTAADTSVDSARDSAPETAETGDPGPLLWACPEGMAPVPADSPSYCIDPYELAYVHGVYLSEAGREPAVGVTFEEAAAACAASSALDDTGDAYANKWIATGSEWEDAGDGTVGAGGTTFPWGDTFDDTRCVTLTEAGEQQVDAAQPTGSAPGCVSTFGVYDQIGNAWEWVDSELTVDITTTLATFAADHLTLTPDDDGALVLAEGDVGRLGIEAAGLQPSTLLVEADGHLNVGADQIQPEPSSFFARGWLRVDNDVAALLPVRMETTDAADVDAPWRVYVADEYDGRAIPDKRGCAWYTGTGAACGLQVSNLVHLPDFDGTIGFRCVAPPFAR